MNYNQMAREYEASAKDISEKLTALRSEKANCCGTALKDILRRIKTLESMYIDCNFTAKIMYERAAKENHSLNSGGNIHEI